MSNDRIWPMRERQGRNDERVMSMSTRKPERERERESP